MKNLTLALQVRDNIRRDPAHFEMSSWGTRSPYFQDKWTACLGGHTLLAAGYRLTTYSPGGPSGFSLHERKFKFFTRATAVHNIRDTAMELLGLTAAEMTPPVSCDSHGGWTVHGDQCSLFCGFLENDVALGNFELLIEREQEFRLALATH